MTIKKIYVDIVELLQANENELVGDVLSQVLELAQSKQMSKAFKCDENGNVIAIYCYYHKMWEDVSLVEYGNKASSQSGLNTMCKVGVNNWTKQQRLYKEAKANMLMDVAKLVLAPDDINDQLIVLEQQRKMITPREHGEGTYHTLEELLEYNEYEVE